MKVKHVLKDNRKSDFVKGIPYLDTEQGSSFLKIDYCLGKTNKEGGEICRQIIELLK